MRFFAVALGAALVLTACSRASERPPTQAVTTPVPPSPVQGSRTPWVMDRIKAIEEIYNITPAGRQWLEGYDLRQMVGQPGWFGSLGSKQWAGVGQAIPNSVLHEVSHSYWGAFPVSGRPDLAWDVLGEGGTPKALETYRQELKTFLFQPPDGFEPLRERFRNLPKLSVGEYPDIYHFGEADLIYSVGGNLKLLPPIIRKYFDSFIHESDYSTWEQAIGWYLGLSQDDRKVADGYFGLTHFPLDRYRDLRPREPTRVPARVRELLEREERQRLVDFAQQFELIKTTQFSLKDAISVDRGFQFWRDYLRDMQRLHQKYPDVLFTQADGKGLELKNALDMVIEGQKLPQKEQVRFFREKLEAPDFRDFAVLLPTRVLVELFGDSGATTTPSSVEGVVAGFSQKLARYVREVDSILKVGADSPSRGARRLEGFLDSFTDKQQDTEMAIIMDLMREADRVTAKSVINNLSDEAFRRIHKNNPAALMNGSIEPWRLLQALNITSVSPRDKAIEGINSLLKYTSGNFRIDEPFVLLTYGVIADRAERSPEEGLAILRETRVPLLRFVSEQPKTARKVLSSDLKAASELVANVKGYEISPWSIVHGIISVDPDLAAGIVRTLGNQGRDDIVAETLIVFAFDARRLETLPFLKLSLENDKLFLQQLIGSMGQEWVQKQIVTAIRKYQGEVQEDRIDPGFIKEYQNTLKRILELEKDTEKRERLAQVFNGAFKSAGLEATFSAP